jgi:hypothetical protein
MNQEVQRATHKTLLAALSGLTAQAVRPREKERD